MLNVLIYTMTRAFLFTLTCVIAAYTIYTATKG